MPHSMPPQLPKGLTAIQRILSMTDGTVTDILSAYREESIELIKRRESLIPLGATHLVLNRQPDETCIERHILLRGKSSKTDLVLAISLLIPERLPSTIRKALSQTGMPIGQIIQQNKTETFREILDISWCPNPQTISHEEALFTLQRRYLIFIKQRPCILIKERFSSVI